MQIDFHPEATAELSESIQWYAERSDVAARGLLVAIDVAITNIVSDPTRFARIDNRHRGCSVARFPFQIVFRHDESRIVIIAFAHGKRRPGYWRDR